MLLLMLPAPLPLVVSDTGPPSVRLYNKNGGGGGGWDVRLIIPRVKPPYVSSGIVRMGMKHGALPAMLVVIILWRFRRAQNSTARPEGAPRQIVGGGKGHFVFVCYIP